MSEDAQARPLFRPEAVRHNTPGLFGEVVLAAPLATWLMTAIAIAGGALIATLLLGLEVEGLPLWRWLAAR